MFVSVVGIRVSMEARNYDEIETFDLLSMLGVLGKGIGNTPASVLPCQKSKTNIYTLDDVSLHACPLSGDLPLFSGGDDGVLLCTLLLLL